MREEGVKFFVFGDVHLANRLNKSETIIEHLNKFWIEYDAKLLSVDIVFIEGDLFDRLIDLSSTNAFLIIGWMVKLIKWCSTNNKKLRVLHGTFSHDWGQSKHFTTLSANIDVDVKYVDTLSIEMIEDFGISVLYVPDEWRTDPADTYQEVIDLMKENNLTKIDIAIMHGQFHYQLPEFIPNLPRHDEQSYLDIIKHYICIGHIHVHTTFDRILAAGSFDRIAHGEEDPKGALLCKIHNTKEDTWEFLENKHATVFKVFIVKDEDTIDKIVKKIDTLVDSYPASTSLDPLHLSIRAKRGHPILSSVSTLRKRYPLLVLSSSNIKEKETTKINHVILHEYDNLILNKDNMAKAFENYLESKKHPKITELTNTLSSFL